MTEADYAFMLADSRARMLVVSDPLLPRFEKLIATSPDLAHVVVSGADAKGRERFEDLLAAAKPDDVTAPTTRDDIAFWLYTSGSTGKPKGAVHVHASLRLTNDLYAAPILGLNENDVCYLGRQAVFCLWARQRDDVSDVGRSDYHLVGGPSDAGRVSRPCCATIRSPCSTACRRSSRASWRARCGAGPAPSQVPPLRVRRRGAAERCRPALGRALRLRHP